MSVVNEQLVEQIQTPNEKLHDAVKEGSLKKVQEALSEGADVNAFDSEGYTPLNQACGAHVSVGEWGSWTVNTEMMEFLIKNKADVNKYSDNGYTPLFNVACRNEGAKAVRILLANKADFALKRKGVGGSTALHFEISIGTDLEAIRLLVAAHADINVPNTWGESPLDFALSKGETAIINALLPAPEAPPVPFPKLGK